MNVEIAERLARRRREAGYSQESLAEKLGVSRQAVSKWERSESSPDTDNLIALAQLYGVSIDELLYVDDSFKDDVAFEAADKAAGRRAQGADYRETAGTGWTKGSAQAEDADDKDRVHVSPGRIHIKDGDDYVQISWKDGVNYRNTKDGEEVHVGWDGVHVKEGKVTWSYADETEEAVRSAEDTGIRGAGIFIGDDDGNIHVVRDFFEKEYGVKSIWLRFPYPLVVIIAYILMGVFLEAWGTGLFLFFTIPVYYMIGNAIHSKRPARFFQGFYPLACVSWFLWMAFIEGAPHPAWVILLTIPLFEWIFHSVSRSYRKRKRAARVIEADKVID